MSQPQVRKIELRLERLMAQGAGPTVGQAVKAAKQNLRELEPACLKVLDTRLAQISAILDGDPTRRPSDDEFAALLAHADEALTACTPLALPLMGQALLLFSAQADALRSADRWPIGALSPAIDFINLVRAGHIEGAAADHVVRELRTCLHQYISFSAPITLEA